MTNHAPNMTHGMLVAACKNLQGRRKLRPALCDWTQGDIVFSEMVNAAAKAHGYKNWLEVLEGNQ